MGLETIISIIIAAITATFGAFFVGRYKGKSKADTDNRIKEADERSFRIIQSNKESTQAQIKASNSATEVKNEIINLNDGDAINELRKHYARDSDGNKSN